MTATLSPAQLREQLRQFTGSASFYRHPLNPLVIYTEGVQFLAEEAGAYWLLDAVASYFGSGVMRAAIAADVRLGAMQFWTLTVAENQTAELVMRVDGGEKPAIRQEIGYTDFPLPAADIWAAFDGKHWTLYLPSEH